MNRRELLRLLAVAVPALAGLSAKQLAALDRSASATLRLRRGLFDPQQFNTVDQLAEIIIPVTSTPGARAAGVAAFIERMVADWYGEDDRAAFLAGLEEVNARSMRASGRVFLDASAGEQDAVAQELEAEAQSRPSSAAATFWNRLKALTVYGYFTSQPGVEDELKLPFMPGYYEGDVPVSSSAGGSH